MRILITGGAGFIGSHLARYCQNLGHTVGIIDRDYSKHKMSDVELKWKVDLTDYSDSTNVNKIFAEFKPDVCFHLAAYASEGRSNHIREYITVNNTLSTMRVINLCVKHNIKLIFTSSVAIYSQRTDDFFSEFTKPSPIDEYGLSKYMSECSMAIASVTQGLKYKVVRPRNVYGPGQNLWDPSRNLFGIWLYNAKNMLPCLIYGNGNQRRQFTYIGDLIPALFRTVSLSESAPDAFNVGSSTSYTINEAAEIFQEVTGYRNFKHVEARHEVKEASCATQFAESYLGWNVTNEVDLRKGLTQMATWANNQFDVKRPLDTMPPLEVDINAHSSLK